MATKSGNETTTSPQRGNLNVERQLPSSVPDHLRIRILFSDDDIVVISKPPNLRSVPGHAVETSKKRKREMSVQDAWMTAIRSFSTIDDDDASNKNTSDATIHHLLSRLNHSIKPGSSVPRKYTKFITFIDRKKRRIFNGESIDKTSIDKMFRRLEDTQRPLLNLPKRTPLIESAVGQLELLGMGQSANFSRVDQSLFTVHRLDMATSGLMVFARNQTSASNLSRSWREGNQVHKTYLCKVQQWPLWTKENKKCGFIDLPLSPSDERLKWKVDPENGKQSQTRWEVLSKQDESPVLLHLTPFTGRTHQLRIHCAAVGSGILGDSLYGRNAETNPSPGQPSSLMHLHAFSLSFPHPTKQTTMKYSLPPEWCSGADLQAIGVDETERVA